MSCMFEVVSNGHPILRRGDVVREYLSASASNKATSDLWVMETKAGGSRYPHLVERSGLRRRRG